MSFKSFLIPGLIALACTSTTASAGCDYAVKDKNLQTAMPMSEEEIRVLISDAKRDVGQLVEEASRYGVTDRK